MSAHWRKWGKGTSQTWWKDSREEKVAFWWSIYLYKSGSKWQSVYACWGLRGASTQRLVRLPQGESWQLDPLVILVRQGAVGCFWRGEAGSKRGVCGKAKLYLLWSAHHDFSPPPHPLLSFTCIYSNSCFLFFFTSVFKPPSLLLFCAVSILFSPFLPLMFPALHKGSICPYNVLLISLTDPNMSCNMDRIKICRVRISSVVAVAEHYICDE